MKAVNSRLSAMSDVIRAIAGAPEAQFDLVANAVYSAAFSIMQAGNKTQFNKLEADAHMYGADHKDATKAIKDALGVAKVTPAVKQFRKVYFAVGVALAQLGIPAMVKDLPSSKADIHAVLDPLAADYADQFVTIFTTTVMMPEKTEAERAEAAAARDAKKAEKEAAAARAAADEERALADTINSEVAARLADAAPVMSLADMARAVAAAMVAGELDADIESALIEAAQARETAALLARAASATAPEAIEA